MPSIRLLFSSVGLTVTVIVFIVLTVLLLYVSYILAIGAAIALVIFITYHVLKASKKHSQASHP